MTDTLLLFYIFVFFAAIRAGRELLTQHIERLRGKDSVQKNAPDHGYKTQERVLQVLWGLLLIVSLTTDLPVGTFIKSGAMKILGFVLLGVGGSVHLLGKYHLSENWTNAAAGPTVRTGSITHHGLYQYTRNPMYLGTMLYLIGVAAILQNIPAFILLAVSYWHMRRNVLNEEQLLLEEKGAPYAAYLAEVPRFLILGTHEVEDEPTEKVGV